jgi:hypothetical protein
VKNWFQSLSFKFNLQRYMMGAEVEIIRYKVGLYTLNQVDPPQLESAWFHSTLEPPIK